MAKFIEHYDNLLADHYSWLWGGLDEKITENAAFFKAKGVTPSLGSIAVDLGAGSGFQSIPLAMAGYQVVAIDLCKKLLAELRQNSPELSIQMHHADLLEFPRYIPETVDLVVCMGDTLPHLNSVNEVNTLFTKVSNHLPVGGKFILTFRDLSLELKELDRFIPVHNDSRKIFTCYLEYETDCVKVHDLIYTSVNGHWQLEKSYYQKLRLVGTWVVDRLQELGLKIESYESNRGLVSIIAIK